MAYQVLSSLVLARTYVHKTLDVAKQQQSAASGFTYELRLSLDLITSSTPTQKLLGCPPCTVCILFSFSPISLSTSETFFNSTSGRTSHNSGSHSANVSVACSVRYNPSALHFHFLDMASTPGHSYFSLAGKPAAQNKGWQVGGVSTSAKWFINVYVFFFFIHSSFYPELTFVCFPLSSVGNDHRWPRTVSLAIPSPCSSLRHATPTLSHTRLHHAPISYDIAFTLSARSRRLHSALPAPSRHACAAMSLSSC